MPTDADLARNSDMCDWASNGVGLRKGERTELLRQIQLNTQLIKSQCFVVMFNTNCAVHYFFKFNTNCADMLGVATCGGDLRFWQQISFAGYYGRSTCMCSSLGKAWCWWYWNLLLLLARFLLPIWFDACCHTPGRSSGDRGTSDTR